MPTLLSPRGATAKTPEEEPVAKKPKGVMGRIKSTFKLGRRKSSSGSASAMAAEAAAAEFIADDKERAMAADESQAKQNNEHHERKREQAEEEEEEEEPVEPYTEERTEVRQFNNDEDASPQQDERPSKVSADEKSERVATFELPAKDVAPSTEAKCDDADEEVFACDYKPGEGPQAPDVKPLADDDDDGELEVFTDDQRSGSTSSGNQSPPAPAAASPLARGFGAPHESDLMVVGVSPAKLRATAGPSLSPVKRSQPPAPQPRPEKSETVSNNQEGPSRADAEPSLGDRVASAHSTRPTQRPAAVPSSPGAARRAQLLSDFQFGSDAVPSGSPVPSSPMKRRGNASPSTTTPPMRRSFQREQELSINAASPVAPAVGSPAASPSASRRKPDTPSALPPTRVARPERRNSLQGISEEASSGGADDAKRPPRPTAGAGRRRTASVEAPILASSFVGSSAAPEVPEDHVEAPSEDASCETPDDATGAFAFDAGAAITQEFGERVARLLGADPWGDRQDGFDAIVYQIKKTDLASAANKRELLCAAVAAVQCGVEDRVAPVMYCALESLRGVLKEFAPVLDRSFPRYAPLNEQLSGLVRAVVGKLGDSNKRTQREATQAVVRLAKLKKLKALPHVLLHLSAKEVAPRQRVETLRVLVKELGVDSQTAMNAEVVMQFAVPVLKIADEKTRKAAVELIAELHLVNGQAVNAQLAAGAVKPEMLRVINRRVDELLAQREAQAQELAAQQSANQSDDAPPGDDRAAAMALLPVPLEESKPVQSLLETLLQQAQGVVGPVVWRKLESKTWSDRKEALVELEKTVTEAKSDLRDVKPAFGSVVQHNFAAYCTVVHKCLSDAIAPVVNSAMDVFATLVKVYGPCVEWRDEPVRDIVMLTVMRLFATMQKPNSRTNRAACRCILKLTRLPTPHTLRYAASCVFAKETDALVQMHLLRLLVPEFGFQPDGLSAHAVLALVGPALGHSSDKVRKTATDVALCTQRLVGKDAVLRQLQDVVKPVTLKELEKSFVDVVEPHKDSERPQTVHAAPAALPPVQFGSDQSRRLLNSAPVGLGKLHCTPPSEDEQGARRASVLSHDEESLMDSILGGDDF